MKTFLQFGAGNIGRSLVGALFSRAGYEVVFADAQREIVDELNARGGYLVRVMEDDLLGAPAEIRVSGVRAVNAADAAAVRREVARAELIGTAVGARAFPAVCAAIASGLPERSAPVTLLFCENIREAARLARERLRAALPAEFDLDAAVGLAETSIGKMVPLMPEEVRKRDPLEVWAEGYNRIIADASGFKDRPPVVEGLELHENFAAYVDRKLFVHNLGHAVCACHGALHGKRCIWECLEDPWIAGEAHGAMQESAAGLLRRYAGEFTTQSLQIHIDDLLRRFANRRLGDTTYRVGRDLERKLAPGDRFAGALRLLRETGVEPEHICRGIAAALCFNAADESGNRLPSDEAAVRFAAENGAEAAVKKYCGLDPDADGEIIARIASRYAALRPAKLA